MRARYSVLQNVQMVKCLLRGSLVPCCFLEEVYSQHPAVEHETTTQHTYLAIPCFVILRTSCVCCRQRSAHAWLHSAAFVCCPTRCTWRRRCGRQITHRVLRSPSLVTFKSIQIHARHMIERCRLIARALLQPHRHPPQKAVTQPTLMLQATTPRTTTTASSARWTT